MYSFLQSMSLFTTFTKQIKQLLVFAYDNVSNSMRENNNDSFITIPQPFFNSMKMQLVLIFS
jgi:hypothetical protein